MARRVRARLCIRVRTGDVIKCEHLCEVYHEIDVHLCVLRLLLDLARWTLLCNNSTTASRLLASSSKSHDISFLFGLAARLSGLVLANLFTGG